MRAPWLREGEGEGELRRNRRGRLVLDERTAQWCRGRYRRWLEERGRRLFGQELEHGDEAGAPGFEAEAEGPNRDPSPAGGRSGAREGGSGQAAARPRGGAGDPSGDRLPAPLTRSPSPAAFAP
jgi:hypothetical protein